jgi:hypothetical protein
VQREDADQLCLFQMRSMAFEHELGVSLGAPADIGARRFSAETFGALYVPPIEHDALELAEDNDSQDEGDDDGYRPGDNTRYDTARIRIGDALVRYRAHNAEVTLTIEGALDRQLVELLCDDLAGKLSALQGVPCRSTRREVLAAGGSPRVGRHS